MPLLNPSCEQLGLISSETRNPRRILARFFSHFAIKRTENGGKGKVCAWAGIGIVEWVRNAYAPSYQKRNRESGTI